MSYMKCKNHPDRQASHHCEGCGKPICDECAEMVKQGVYMCFGCAMLQSISRVDTAIGRRHEKATHKRLSTKKKTWGPFHYFVTASSLLILAMWGTILFGGQKAPSVISNSHEGGKAGRVFLFMVDNAIRRYAHHENNGFPLGLVELVPDYLKIKGQQMPLLKQLTYKRDENPKIGYSLSFEAPKEDDLDIIITSQGLHHVQPGAQEI